ncbi:hypothetical protein [Facklamia sp. 7083-14-GEN3]|uniref:hypothetical protein n=1 Tax=Facklamia sp. 7083-14-GEN3 TaxID=2973478 RepID=UPI00215C5556|nr:hypothetical protein [Facklamia sp. 7083-14-GEN3]MCR8969009.1 hypothetical protein [Facklamia sp. 7083-14-GEN3]
MTMFLMLPLTVSAQEEIADFEGSYWDEENLNIIGIEIEEDSLIVTLNRNYFSDEAFEADYADAIQKIYTEEISQDSRLMMVSTDGEEEKRDMSDEEVIFLRFSREVPFAIRVQMQNPTYRIKDQKLTISFVDKELFSFELDEDGNLVDEKGNQFMLKEKN